MSFSGGRYQTRETFRIADGHVSEYFPVEADTDPVESADELTVGHAVGPSQGVDADDPKPPHVPLALPAVGGGVAQGLHH